MWPYRNTWICLVCAQGAKAAEGFVTGFSEGWQSSARSRHRMQFTGTSLVELVQRWRNGSSPVFVQSMPA